MNEREIARAIAYFEACVDRDLLLEVLRSIRPRAAAEVRRQERRGRPLPLPLTVAASDTAATRREALATVRSTTDFAELQALSRAIGRRVEELSGSGP